MYGPEIRMVVTKDVASWVWSERNKFGGKIRVLYWWIEC